MVLTHCLLLHMRIQVQEDRVRARCSSRWRWSMEISTRSSRGGSTCQLYMGTRRKINHFDLCTHLWNDEHRINMTISPTCSWHCTALHCILPQQRLELYEDPGRPGRENGSRRPSRVQGTIQYGPWIISRCVLLNSIPFTAPHAPPLLSSASIVYVIWHHLVTFTHPLSDYSSCRHPEHYRHRDRGRYKNPVVRQRWSLHHSLIQTFIYQPM